MIQSKMKFVAMLLLSLIAHIAAWDTPSAYKQGPPQKVKIADVEVITLQKGRMTTGRRNSPVPQLECMGGCGDWTPDVVQCRNVGTDGVDANWKCDAEMPQGYRFGQIQVGCEGYDHPEDPYILPGSCQLMYELKGSQARGGAARTQQQQQQYQPQQGSSSDDPLPGWVVWGVIAVLIVLVVVYGKKDTAGGARSSGVPVAQAYTVHEDSSGPSGPKPTAQAYPAGSSSGSGIGAGTAFAAGAAAGGAAGFAAGRYTAPGARQRGGGTSGGRGDRGGSSSHDRDDNFQQQSGFSGTARR
uniref:Store-operated calcium entry-associated regulatory factor n=1 Tax=Heterosigma akashiwo TaxID=2829 RepID=A0A6T5NZL0_HETAK|mmetsp:Transcript_2103/g.2865  ORF Transcript_2103/g.2865 Transcript_2103/m.2865 type:complete len:299 (-) Transcript_2103:315-1211(-)